MNRKASVRDRQQGSVLLAAVVMVMILGLGGAALLKYLHVTLAETKRHENTEIALHLAEAGLDKAVAMLRVQPQTYRGESATPLGVGSFSVRVKPEEKQGAYRLSATGTIGEEGRVRLAKTLEAQLSLSPAGEVTRYSWVVKRGKQARAFAQGGGDQ